MLMLRVLVFMLIVAGAILFVLWLIDYFFIRPRKLLVAGAKKYHDDKERIADEEIKSWDEEERKLREEMNKQKHKKR